MLGTPTPDCARMLTDILHFRCNKRGDSDFSANMPRRIDSLRAWPVIDARNKYPNMSLTQIARHVGGISRSGVTAVLKRYASTNDPLVRKGQPRATRRKLTADQAKAIIDYTELHPFASLTTIKTGLGLNVSHSTITRRLREVGLNTHRPARKPRLTVAHKEERLLFCNQRLDELFDWNRVFFSDESTVSTSQEKGVDWVRRYRGKRYEEQNLRKTSASGRVSVHVWGGMTILGPTKLVRIKGRLTSQKYVVQILSRHVKPFFADPANKRIIFQQDNSPVHRANHTQSYLERSHVPTMKWPACSPDLSPIENYWQALKRKVGNVHFEGGTPEQKQDQLWNTIKTAWEELAAADGALEHIQRYYEGMPARILACKEARGGSTRY